MKKILSNICTWAALCMMGAAMLAGCSSDDDSSGGQTAGNETGARTYHMTVLASKGGDATTRALTYNGGTKALDVTWAEGDKVYAFNVSQQATLGGHLKAKTAGETVTLEGDLTGTVAVGDVLVLAFPQLDQDYTHQDGTLATIASTCDYAWGIPIVSDNTGGKITLDVGGSSLQFMNMQAIVRFTLLDKADDSAINATSLTIDAKDASSTSMLKQTFVFATNATTCGPVTITPSSPETNVIYAALGTYESNDSYDYTLAATDEDGETYTYTKTGVTFEWGKYYEIKVKMNRQPRTYDLSEAKGNITLKDGDVLTGTLDGEEQPYKISIAPGATVTLDGATINGWSDNAADASHSSVAWAGLTCLGDATIILKEGTTNTVRGFYDECSGIQPGSSGTTLTIQGSGSLTANGSSGEWGGAGIGSGCSTCGNITITGGIITATGGSGAAGIGSSPNGSCGNITITGGNITATGGSDDYAIGGAGIGCGCWPCGEIRIGGTAHVEATGGLKATGIGSNGGITCGNITITGGNGIIAWKGSGADYSVGVPFDSDGCEVVTIHGTIYRENDQIPNYGCEVYLSQSPLKM